MMTIEEIRKRKKELGFSNQQLADLAGVPVGTLSKILSGATGAPRYATLAALEAALRKPSAAYRLPGGYTLQDYLDLPDDGPRKELIDGVFYDMGEPATAHQAVAGYIYKKLMDYVMEKKGSCMPMISPLAVQLDRDDKTVVEPDVCIICDRQKFKNRRIFGAPDFVLEVLSPSTRRKDMNLKHYKYQHAGVREYWLIDPFGQELMAYDFSQDNFPAIYTFADRVPVLIWEGECVIDLAEMKDWMGFLLEEEA